MEPRRFVLELDEADWRAWVREGRREAEVPFAPAAHALLEALDAESGGQGEGDILPDEFTIRFNHAAQTARIEFNGEYSVCDVCVAAKAITSMLDDAYARAVAGREHLRLIDGEG